MMEPLNGRHGNEAINRFPTRLPTTPLTRPQCRNSAGDGRGNKLRPARLALPLKMQKAFPPQEVSISTTKVFIFPFFSVCIRRMWNFHYKIMRNCRPISKKGGMGMPLVCDLPIHVIQLPRVSHIAPIMTPIVT